MLIKRHRLIIIMLLVGVVLAITGCGGGTSEAEPSTSTPSDGPQNEEPSNDEGENEDEEQALDFPTRNLEIIVSAGPGGGSDNFGRAVAQELADILGVSVNVINMPGANGAVARQEVLNRPADGYTLLTAVSTFQTELAQDNIEQADKFQGLVLFHEDTYGLHVKGDGPYADIETFIEEAKANPGALRVGGTYPLTLDELVVRKLESEAGIELTYVPYDSAGSMHSDLLGGHIEAVIDEFGPVLELLEAGEFRTLVALADERIEDFPDVPTTVEKGLQFTDGMTRGLIIRSDTPEEIKDFLQEKMREVYETERYQEFARNSLLHLKDAFLFSDDYNALIEKQAEEYRVIYERLEE